MKEKLLNKEELFALLSAHWLRPETALWRALDMQAMKDFVFEHPSLDLGCGDGLFSFLRAGGRFSLDFDSYDSVSNINDFFNNADVYDHFNKELNIKVAKPTSYKIDVACDHKENLLSKAQQLDFYNDFVCCDANGKLPFAENSFKSIFSNIVYWLADPLASLKEIQRILQPEGMVCLMLPNSSFVEYSFYYNLYIKQKREEFAFLAKLDRGRISDNIKHAKTYAEWEKIFKQAGLNVEKHSMHLDKQIIQMWDIGLRPLFPVLLKMIHTIPKEQLMDIKTEWLDIFMQFLEPLGNVDFTSLGETEPAFHMFWLKKSDL